MGKKLIIFDLDGTLVVPFTTNLLPGVKEWFDTEASKYELAIASNQGGVGLRNWMELGGFGEPHKYPTKEQVQANLKDVLAKLGVKNVPCYVAYRYQSKKGDWSPIPLEENENPAWTTFWRKPNPGMLLSAMECYGIPSKDTVMVGDWDEDREAAQKAGCAFVHADKFFGRDDSS